MCEKKSEIIGYFHKTVLVPVTDGVDALTTTLDRLAEIEFELVAFETTLVGPTSRLAGVGNAQPQAAWFLILRAPIYKTEECFCEQK